MTGSEVIYILFIFSVVSTVTYLLSYFNNNLLKTGKITYWIMSLGLIFVSSFFLSNIISHNFQYAYIYNHSNTEMSSYFLLASFYAGQEGSFLLWALLLSVIGIFLQPYAAKYKYEPVVMGLYSLVLMFLLLLMIVQSPFEFVWDYFKGQNVAEGFMPKNGRGMNPVLENYWMTIHPPILFVGYALLSIPFVFAIAGLIKKEFTYWIEIALPWTLLGTAIYGVGIALGGVWSYETLGWGGYWAWDPVENASFIPWLTAVAMVHTMKVQRKTGGLVKTNFFLAIITFILVLYSTFLTRSGVLSESSVHSFAAAADTVYYILLAFLLFFLIAGLIVIIFRMKELPIKKMDFNLSSRELILSIGAMMILGIALITFFGTSTPIYQKIFGMKVSQVEISFYDRWSYPFMVLIMILSGLSLYLKWKAKNDSTVIRKNLLNIILTVILTALAIVLGVNEIKYVILVFAASYGFVVNLRLGFKKIFIRPRGIGAFIGHIGVAVLMIGVTGDNLFTEKQRMIFREGESQKVLDYTVTLKGKEQIEVEKKDREKYRFLLDFNDGSSKFTASPVLYLSAFNNYSSPMFEPDIRAGIFTDVYVTPLSLNYQTTLPTLYLNKFQPQALPYDSSKAIELQQFDMSRMMNSGSPDDALLAALVKINTTDTVFFDTLYTKMIDQDNFEAVWKYNERLDYYIGFTGFIPNNESMAKSQAIVSFKKTQDEEMDYFEILTVEVSKKPLISFVWLGFLLINIGFVFPIKKPKLLE